MNIYIERGISLTSCVTDLFISDQFETVLWKKGKDNKQYLKRIFLLSQKDFTLRYFIKEDVGSPYNSVSIHHFF